MQSLLTLLFLRNPGILSADCHTRAPKHSHQGSDTRSQNFGVSRSRSTISMDTSYDGSSWKRITANSSPFAHFNLSSYFFCNLFLTPFAFTSTKHAGSAKSSHLGLFSTELRVYNSFQAQVAVVR